MIYLVDSKGNLEQAKQREPSASHWDIYRRAYSTEPKLCQALYDIIAKTVQSEFNAGTKEFPNSSWLGSRILSSWNRKADWDAKFDKATSGPLFGQIMWTYMWDDPHDWCTITTQNANEGKEERVYFLT